MTRPFLRQWPQWGAIALLGGLLFSSCGGSEPGAEPSASPTPTLIPSPAPIPSPTPILSPTVSPDEPETADERGFWQRFLPWQNPAPEDSAAPPMTPTTTTPDLTDTPNLDDLVPNLGESASPTPLTDDGTGSATPTERAGIQLTQRVNGTGRTMQIDVPSDWQIDMGIHNEAEIRVSNQAEFLYLIVLADPKSNQQLSDPYRQSVAYQDQFIAGLDSVVYRRPTDVVQVGGYDAFQIKIDGQIQNIPVAYLHTTVDTPRAYYQILGWTFYDQFDRYQLELQVITDSFRPYAEN